jgi:dTDP-4-dehydrorhamnose reductase
VRQINGQGTRYIAEACKALDCKMMYISTDYVFNGQGESPWQPDCKDYAPLSVYGQSKLEGELAVSELLEKYFIVRIAWVFGKNGNNFVKTMLRLAETHDRLRVVDDQIGSPTFTADLAPLLCNMIATDKYGVYHATNEGFCSWAELAEAVFRIAGKNVTVHPVSTEEYGAKALRPKNSRLSKASLDARGFARLPEWEASLARLLEKGY